jgi:hypothetical protein
MTGTFTQAKVSASMYALTGTALRHLTYEALSEEYGNA